MKSEPVFDLPQPTTVLDQLKSDLDSHGYALIEDAMSADQVETLLGRLKEQAEAERQLRVAYEDGGPNQDWGRFRADDGHPKENAFTAAAGGVNQRVWMLVNKGQVFRDLLANRPVRQLIDYTLGPEYLLSSYGANIVKPGGLAMDLHTDQWWMPEPVRRGPAKVPVGSISRQQSNWTEDEPPELIASQAAVNVMWMLADFTEENGATRIVPGSHLTGERPNHREGVRVVAATAKAGTAMVFDGRTWHGTGANVGTSIRYGILTTFCGPMFRTQENFVAGVDSTVLEQASNDLLQLLGFKIWNGYGRIESPLAGFISRGDSAISEIKPE